MSKKGARRSTRKQSMVKGVRMTYWAPEIIRLELDKIAAEEGCSRSWLITSLVCKGLGLDESKISELRGYKLPKRFEDRVGDWTPHKEKEKLK